MSVIALLKSIFLFSNLTDEQLRDLAEVGSTKSLEADQIVFAEGDEADGLYVVLEGKVRIYRRDEVGSEVEFATQGAGDFFGEMALLDGKPRSATVACVEPCTFFILGRDEFVALLARSTRLLIEVLTVLSSRVRHIDQQYMWEMLRKERMRAEMESARQRSLALMVAGVAHEINTPLGIINTAADVVAQSLAPDTVVELAKDDETKCLLADLLEAAKLIGANIARARKLVEKFKSLSVRQDEDVREKVDLPALVADTVALFKINARQARLKIDLRNNLRSEEREWDGYPGYLSQIILNLLSNVERYAYPDGAGGTVEIILTADCERQEPSFSLTVRDLGRGIPAEDLPKVTEPFFTTGHDKGGTGLGMSIVHNMVTSALQGTLKIKSQLGMGTTVTVSFPQADS
jgi:signal transduction histidine kinase